MRPYIGITDFTNHSQVLGMKAIFDAKKPAWMDRVLHVGVMMSYKTLMGLPTKWADAFPPKENIPSIFQSGDVYNCLHYADYDDPGPDGGRRQFEGLCHMIAVVRDIKHLSAIQLDMPWPDPKFVEIIKLNFYHDVEIILQVGGKSIDSVNGDPAEGGDPKNVVERLREYEEIIDRILLDKSMGGGKEMNAPSLLAIIRAIKEEWPDIEDAQIVVAGGLGPETMHFAEPIIQEFPGVSNDAQGRLRPSGNALHPIAWNMAAAYLDRSLALYARYQK